MAVAADFETDCIVIGAGVVGLAVAAALAGRGREVLVVEAEGTIGSGTSSRNSEVIHAGLYYPQDSLKARLCVRGKELLYAYCGENGVPHRRVSKLVVASDPAELPVLERIAANARGNGVEDVAILDGAEAMRLEPALRAAGALFSPGTGIVDSHALMMALRAQAEAGGATFAFHAPVVGGLLDAGRAVIRIGGDQPASLGARTVINAAGLHAHRVAASIEGVEAASVPRIRYAKGNYYALGGKAPFSRLIYPVPEPGGLGVHLTLDLAGKARFGPDVEWVDGLDFGVDPARSSRFYAAIRRYWPGLPDGALHPDYAGIRPKIDGEQAADFRFDASHDCLVSLYGIESPGLTGALAIAEHVCELCRRT